MNTTQREQRIIHELSRRGVDITLNRDLSDRWKKTITCRNPQIVDDETAELIATLSSIEAVFLYGQSISDNAFAGFAAHDELAHLNVNSTSVDGSGLHHLHKCTGLQELDLVGTAITDDALKDIGKLRSLCILRLADTSITDLGVAELRHLPRLELLSLSGTKVTDECLVVCREFPRLRYLFVGDTRVTPSAVARLKDDRPEFYVSLKGDD